MENSDLIKLSDIEVGDAFYTEDDKVVVIEKALYPKGYRFSCRILDKDGSNYTTIIFSRHNTKVMRRFNLISMSDCGYYSRLIYLNPFDTTKVHIGCFVGTQEEAIDAIKAEYKGCRLFEQEIAILYINKVNELFYKGEMNNDR